MRLLIERDDIDTYVKTNCGNTPLSQAANNGHEAIVLLLSDRHEVRATG